MLFRSPVDAAGFAQALVGHPNAGLASTLPDAGFRRGATRTWSGPGGASLTAVVGLWDDGEPASAIGGQAVDAVAALLITVVPSCAVPVPKNLSSSWAACRPVPAPAPQPVKLSRAVPASIACA